MEARENWVNDQSEMDGSSIVFLDESSINIGMTSLYGSAYGEERVIDYVPDVRFDRINHAIESIDVERIKNEMRTLGDEFIAL